ncbi:MAG: phospholipase D-like domain-containing protein [Nocardioidaceae bacterium]|nr:phospholipase D-like domain-containing protein [Nocardioidaceae bacterium]MCL2613076.1 phospholipase D-like domain-containing protein [Nocardioidaceae bacterium]
MKRFATVLVAAVSTVALSGIGQAVGNEAGAVASAHHGSQKTTAKKKWSAYQVKSGVIFNDPRVKKRQGVVLRKDVAAIDHAPKNSHIYAVSWNFYHAPGILDALIRAHRRGVSVRFITARELKHANFGTLKRALNYRNSRRPAGMRSFAKTCDHSCRGSGGSMHAKWIAISRSGSSKDVVMEGSHNFTGSAASNQWNDWYTVVGNQKIFNAYVSVFAEMAKDKKAGPVQVSGQGTGNRIAWFSPRGGKGDLVMQLLDKVKCGGSKVAGYNGHTMIRIASAVIQGSRGDRIANRIRTLNNQGCNIKVIYTMAPNRVLQEMGSTPVRHLAFDSNGDGAYDTYLHMKAMTIVGHLGSNTKAHTVFNGSANWSGMGEVSDEQGMVINDNPSLEHSYTTHINTLFGVAVRPRAMNRALMRRNGITDPYQKIRSQLIG